MSYISAHQANLRLKMDLINYAWFCGSHILSDEFGETYINVAVSCKTAETIMAMNNKVPNSFFGFKVKVVLS
jgi:hypothetical protein